MSHLRLAAEAEWMAQLDAIMARMGLSNRVAVVERLIAERAIAFGLEPVQRLQPNKYNPWIEPAERAAAG